VIKRSWKAVEWLFILALALGLPVTTIAKARGRTTLSPAAKAGKKVFDQNCAMCHYANQAKRRSAPA